MAMRKPRHRGLVTIGIVIVVALAGAMFTYDAFFREQPPTFYASDEDHFLFGSIGTEAEQGVPYWIWLVLPRIFPDLLPGPGGYASLGIVSKPGYEMPIGFSKVTVGFPRVGINCAMCHTASVRLRADDAPLLFPGAPSHQTTTQGYVRFLTAAAEDPRFSADTILAEIAKNYRLSSRERLLYRFAIIPAARRGLQELGRRNAWMTRKPDWGAGRIDPFNPVKFGILAQPIDGTIGNADMMPLWRVTDRHGAPYHSDGLNASLQEVVLSSALGDGATRAWVDRDFARWNDTDVHRMSSLRRVQNYIGSLTPPAYPFSIDRTLAAAGAGVYRSACASCHGRGGARTGTVVPVSEVGTDRHRLDMWTGASAAAYNDYGTGHVWKFSHFRTTNGYLATPLDGLWLRAPYLHNGSVPSLTALLDPADERPRRFWRGDDLYDPAKVGFVSDGPEAERIGTMYDVSLAGNSNQGHAYGTTLPRADKRALLEFLKTR